MAGCAYFCQLLTDESLLAGDVEYEANDDKEKDAKKDTKDH